LHDGWIEEGFLHCAGQHSAGAEWRKGVGLPRSK
jgi:hypothetical protein